MRSRFRYALVFVVLLASCEERESPPLQPVRVVRVVNANTSPVDVTIDGVAVFSDIAPGAVDSTESTVGEHMVVFRETTSSTTASLQLKVGAVGSRTIAALRAGTSLSGEMLDDTNAVVAPGKTKVRVLHLAPNAGEITVMRTQPDYQTPVSWQFPFVYSASITAEGNPYYESTPGTWDVRAWRKPSEDALGWNATTAHVAINLASGQKRTVLVLDKAGGGITLRVIE